MIYECTDCEHCLSFDFGFRIACGHKQLSADDVYKYHPLGNDDAENCEGFDEGMPEEFPNRDIDKAVELFGDDISSLRKWAEQPGV